MESLLQPSMIVGYFPINNLIENIKAFVSEDLMLNIDSDALHSIEQLKGKLINNLNCYFEYPYVDKVFRDSYYNYYSTKLNSIHKNCARISFFAHDIKEEYFRQQDKFGEIQRGYYGYIIIRPTHINILGRNTLSPKAFRTKIGCLCLTRFQSTINGVHLNVRSFPHSSQDTETLSCAETTIWSVMEYFGNRYPEYKPVLPSNIHQILALQTFERQLPSAGLNPEQISYALKAFGFGTKIYSLAKANYDIGAYDKASLRHLLGHYIESGIPVIAAIENENIAHALVVIGHNDIDFKSIDYNKLSPENAKHGSHKFKIYDYSDLIENYVSIDDNLVPYTSFSFDDPTCAYSDPEFESCEIVTLVVPMYHKLYLEAPEAKAYCISFLEDWYLPEEESCIILRLFCTTSRSLKAELNERVFIGEDANEIILSTSMPKFVWVGEITTPDLLKDGKACSLVILDAMETVTELSRICFVQQDAVIVYNQHHAPNETGYKEYTVETNSFNIFANNLKQY